MTAVKWEEIASWHKHQQCCRTAHALCHRPALQHSTKVSFSIQIPVKAGKECYTPAVSPISQGALPLERTPMWKGLRRAHRVEKGFVFLMESFRGRLTALHTSSAADRPWCNAIDTHPELAPLQSQAARQAVHGRLCR
jgi:hypothetical protein